MKNVKVTGEHSSPLLLLLLLLLISGCGPEKETIPVGERIISTPQQSFDNAELTFYEDGVRRWDLDADYMSRPLADTGEMLVVPVRINVYDSLGKKSARIVSDSGASDFTMTSFDLWGSVFIKNEDGMTVKSERLKWHKNSRRITSETHVQIQTPRGDLLRGKGLDAVDDFSRFTFKADVRGRFPDFKKRMEENDDGLF